ncbi:hypothetical protein V502_04305 [Pseudogymnoascus sp. VKM F-4520 (FW-2644)]|nr:hypothetical protein V502_04305 [Pseudogymnoascus sp. VKM F-4520 (FW-2644)]
MATYKNGGAQASSAKEHASKPKDKKAAKSSATLHKYLHDSPSVQERMAYQPVDKKYWKDKKASSKTELERLEKIINKV